MLHANGRSACCMAGELSGSEEEEQQVETKERGRPESSLKGRKGKVCFEG